MVASFPRPNSRFELNHLTKWRTYAKMGPIHSCPPKNDKNISLQKYLSEVVELNKKGSDAHKSQKILKRATCAEEWPTHYRDRSRLNKKSTTPTIQFLTCPLLKFIIVYKVFQFMFIINLRIYRRAKVFLKLFKRII